MNPFLRHGKQSGESVLTCEHPRPEIRASDRGDSMVVGKHATNDLTQAGYPRAETLWILLN